MKEGGGFKERGGGVDVSGFGLARIVYIQGCTPLKRNINYVMLYTQKRTQLVLLSIKEGAPHNVHRV